MSFENVYEDDERANSYAQLEFPGTYYLAFRDLAALIAKHVNGKSALDFGCGAGRSTRYLKRLGFDAIGIDISESMVARARDFDPEGDYRLVNAESLADLPAASFDLILAAFPFDNIPSMEWKVSLLGELRALLKPGGAIVNLVSTPDIYLHEWASFSTKDFPENSEAVSGDPVRIIMTDVGDQRPVEDIVWSDEAYRETYRQAELELIETHKPLGHEDEPYGWVNETRIAPWAIYILKR